MKNIVIWTVLLTVVAASTFAQGRRGSRKISPRTSQPQQLIERQDQQIKSQEYAEIFRSVERGMNSSNVGMFSGHFAPQVYVSLPNGEKGYFSGNQAHYIVQNYLLGRRIQSFALNYSGTPDTAPYATGQGRSEARGSVENIRAYVSLSRLNNQWVVTQLTIY